MNPQAASTSHPAWVYPEPFGWRSVLVLVAAFALLMVSGQRMQVDRMLAMTGNAILEDSGFAGESESAQGLGEVLGRMLPLQVSERQEISRIDNFDPSALPPFAYLETVEVSEPTIDPVTLELEDLRATRTYLVRPFGYIAHVSVKMLETLEMALWGTLIAVTLGLPLALLGARNITRAPVPRVLARSVVSFMRSVPELISALFLVIAYGFGPIAGYLALGLHGAGALGRFFADEIENIDRQPQEALAAIGAGRLAIWWLAVLPQVLPQNIGSTLYVLDRNVRMATVIGLVGAGGIGQELKGRYDMYDYGHVGTILLAIFLIVLSLDRLSERLRSRFL